MTEIDPTAEAIGYIRGKVQAIDEKLDHLHECLHDDGGVIPRVNRLENGQARQQGMAAGLGILGGASAATVLKLIFAKLAGG